MADPLFTADVLTVFPEMFPGYLGHSLAGKALDEGLWKLNVTNIRDFASDRHRTVDDTPFGGGAGMVMHEGGWSVQVECADCSAHTIYMEYNSEE